MWIRCALLEASIQWVERLHDGQFRLANSLERSDVVLVARALGEGFGMSDIGVVIPCWNEGENVDQLVEAMRVVPWPEHWSVRVLFVDDGSADSTWSRIVNICHRESLDSEPNLHIDGIRLPEHSGKGVAQAVGLWNSLNADVVVFMDGDGQHPAPAIPLLVEAVRESGSPAIASRSGYKRTWASSAGVLGLSMLMRLLGIGFNPKLSEFMALPGQVATTVARSSRLGIAPLLPLIVSATDSLCEVSVAIAPRVASSGGSRWSLIELWRKALLQILADPWKLLPRMTLMAIASFLTLLGLSTAAGIHAILQGTSPGTVAILGAVVVLTGLSVGMWVASTVISVMTLQLIDRQVQSPYSTTLIERWNDLT